MSCQLAFRFRRTNPDRSVRAPDIRIGEILDELANSLWMEERIRIRLERDLSGETPVRIIQCVRLAARVFAVDDFHLEP